MILRLSSLTVIAFPLMTILSSSALPLTRIDSPESNPMEEGTISIPHGGIEMTTLHHRTLRRRTAPEYDGEPPSVRSPKGFTSTPNTHDDHQGVLRRIAESNPGTTTGYAAALTHDLFELRGHFNNERYDEADEALKRMYRKAVHGKYGKLSPELEAKAVELARTRGLEHQALMDSVEVDVRSTIEFWRLLGMGI